LTRGAALHLLFSMGGAPFHVLISSCGVPAAGASVWLWQQQHTSNLGLWT
jgi:hypothetical protein